MCVTEMKLLILKKRKLEFTYHSEMEAYQLTSIFTSLVSRLCKCLFASVSKENYFVFMYQFFGLIRIIKLSHKYIELFS
jgi:hypothetical protein